MEKIDLHIHTNMSDGISTPESVVSLAKNNGCKLISITDHEVLNDFSELGEEYGIKIIPGIEFNTSLASLHILGYCFKDFEPIINRMTELRNRNRIVSLEVIKKLQDDNFDISVEKIINYLDSIGVNFDIMDKRKIVKYLIYKGYANGILDAYNKLIGKGQKYYIPNIKINPQEIIKLINSCEGIAVLAHPHTLNLNYNELYNLVNELKEYGLAGIEVINGVCFNDDAKRISSKLGLLETAGSDYHDSKTAQIGIEVENEFSHTLQKKLINKKNMI